MWKAPAWKTQGQRVGNPASGKHCNCRIMFQKGDKLAPHPWSILHEWRMELNSSGSHYIDPLAVSGTLLSFMDRRKAGVSDKTAAGRKGGGGGGKGGRGGATPTLELTLCFLYRIYRKKRFLEIYPGDGSLMRSKGPVGNYFNHWCYHGNQVGSVTLSAERRQLSVCISWGERWFFISIFKLANCTNLTVNDPGVNSINVYKSILQVVLSDGKSTTVFQKITYYECLKCIPQHNNIWP